jgi:predicted dehydrogenase
MSEDPTAPVRVAIFGNGFARKVILPCLRQVKGVRVVGIASPSIERLRETAAEFGIERAAAEHREILDACRPDLVFVTSPPHRHMEMAIDALRAGCHVVCEKPMAMDAAQTRAMCDAARDARTARDARAPLALIDHELRFTPTRSTLRDLVAEGRIGRILKVEYLLRSPSRRDPDLPWTWWSDRDQGGGALGAIGSHAIDAMRVFAGEIAEARGWLETFVRERRDPVSGGMREVTADDITFAWLRFVSGTIGSLSISLAETNRSHRILLTGTSGSARVVEQGTLQLAVGSERWVDAPVADDLPPSNSIGIPDSDWARAFVRYARAIASAIREGKPAVDGAATFEDGHRTQLVLDAIRRSDGSEKWVRTRE